MYARLQENRQPLLPVFMFPASFDAFRADGEQGIGKSTIVKDLVGSEYYSKHCPLRIWMTNREPQISVESANCGYEKDIEKVKAFLSPAMTNTVLPTVEWWSPSRQCIIIATVNGERGYLRDITVTAVLISSASEETEKDLELC